MLSSILESIQDQVGPELIQKVGVSEDQLPQVMDVVGDASKSVLGKQLTSGNIGSLMNLFSSGDNNSGANSLQSDLTNNIVSGLASKLGLSESKAQMISSIVVPMLIKMVTSKNEETPDDDSAPLQDLFGGKEGASDLLSSAKKGLGGLFN